MNTLQTKLTAFLFWLIDRIGVSSDVCTYPVIVRWSPDDDAYIATAPSIPGVSGIGDTACRATYELGVAIWALLDSADEDGVPYPPKGELVNLHIHGDPIAHADDNREGDEHFRDMDAKILENRA